MKKKYLPSIKKAVLTDVDSEIEATKGIEILEHGLGTNNKYYLLLRYGDKVEDSYLEIIQYDVKDVPEETVEEFSIKLEELKGAEEY